MSTEEPNAEVWYRQRLALDLVLRALDRTERANARLDERSVRYVSLSSALSAVLVAPQMLGVAGAAPAWCIAMAVACSVALVALAAVASWPQDTAVVGLSDERQMHRLYVDPSTDAMAAARALTNSCQVLEASQKANAQKSRWTKAMLIALGVQLVAVLFAVVDVGMH